MELSGSVISGELADVLLERAVEKNDHRLEALEAYATECQHIRIFENRFWRLDVSLAVGIGCFSGVFGW